jgi:hypothetical protein
MLTYLLTYRHAAAAATPFSVAAILSPSPSSHHSVRAALCASPLVRMAMCAGELFSWGAAGAPLGYEDGGVDQLTPRAVRVPALSGALPPAFAHIAAGTKHSLAASRCGKVYAWGANGRGQLGLSGRDDSTCAHALARSRAAARAKACSRFAFRRRRYSRLAAAAGIRAPRGVRSL